MFVFTAMFTWQSDVNLGCHPFGAICLTFCGKSFTGTYLAVTDEGWNTNPWGSSCLCLPSDGVTAMCPLVQLFLWVLGIKTQVLVRMQDVLTEPLPQLRLL